eukprot:gnl/TRDRNA2_/TRDRNA2_169142_c0_seq1.p1 gnl/TRDRNA2_/TRDRNA2_169142_c0~~gnl/TRDRNA2_/TRDRNA2_169142_c0_seq1.p1  ORF type:complete len:101 (-),score=17.47 gnl/TRDRNA2_/TRDRNA2_169142_c0_seq1:64-366(-)
MFARNMEYRVGEFAAQDLINAAWAFMTAGTPAPFKLDPLSVLETMESHSSQSLDGYGRMLHYRMSMHCLAATGQIVAGFALLARAEASGLLSDIGIPCFL